MERRSSEKAGERGGKLGRRGPDEAGRSRQKEERGGEDRDGQGTFAACACPVTHRKNESGNPQQVQKAVTPRREPLPVQE
jgi:hypothetical protein